MSADKKLSMPGEGEKTARLFFALWPDAGVRRALDQAGSKLHLVCGGRRMQAPNVHLTLVFLGNVALARLDELRALAGCVSGYTFAMTLDHLGWWRHNRVAWAAPQETPEALRGLVALLQEGLRNAGFDFDDRPVFAPHVTLLRNARCNEVEMPSLEPLEWTADEFVLVKSASTDAGATYEVIGRWGLSKVSEENDAL
ncbi:MAG: RNA 2',3'-cyclic phosphodiesterase [Sulfurimicrobium sp.]|nr:RNA 2',3'-cyclic phosphodiesterase [Sulfurimicrobium sp.]MDO9189706.1 RNA 2',3'-cyclic phosphodiesterase [Sulfurimicrobium sp.]MDP1704665.1 RNA 2',3'-cyclic phosphodiesterase [Sulfurimicrobium sp.]MDP2200018.1 RNA 2',3'-cyclic phosphodiesterase [Sulfurimicrobium sp.]MDP3687739.1 RNA 2',3'-cyclic phosphodiesterase [Sulfurimicrobium sp.]